MGLSKFDIFTYQLSTISQSVQLSLFDTQLTSEEIFKKKNEILNLIFNADLSFYHRRHKLKYKIEYFSNDYILLRLANIKTVHIEESFHRKSFTSEPSCLIVIDNTSSSQTIGIESDKASFDNSFTIVKIIQKALERSLNKHNLKIKFNPKYEEKDLWNLLNKHYKQIEGLKFEFEYPNLPRVNKYLSDELRDISKTLHSDKTRLEFIAGDKNNLENLNPNNHNLNNLVKASAEGAGPVKIKIKGYKRWEMPGNKVKSVEYDELEIDAPPAMIDNYVLNLIERINNE